MSDFYKKIVKIQENLNAPKGQQNTFGNYAYRSAEDILLALKPLMVREGLFLVISDEVVNIGERYYVKVTAKISDGQTSIENTAFAREALAKKGMDDSQITGSTSSYARKYALNGLLCIDDNKDADSMKSTTISEEINEKVLTDGVNYINANEDYIRSIWKKLTPELQKLIQSMRKTGGAK